MAIIKPGPLVSEARGKIGGVVFSRNKGGLYVRNFAAPTQGESAARNDQRSAFGVSSHAWNALSNVQRSGWEGYGATVGRTNSLGERHPMTGHQAFIRGNAVLQRIGQPLREDPPIAYVSGPMVADVSLTIDGILPSPGLDFSGVVPTEFSDDSGWVIVSTSRWQNPGRQSPAGLELQQVGVAPWSYPTEPPAVDPELSVDNLALTHSGPQPENSPVMFVRLRVITVDGRLGSDQTFRVVSQATT